MAGRPELTKGYLGPQAKFAEFGLSTVSHNSPEIALNCNEIEVKFRMSRAIKVSGNLINCRSSEEQPQFVFTQMKGDIVSFVVALPETGYYKFQVFALPLPDESKTLPGVYNYLLNCTNVTKAANAFPKQFAQWKEGCYIVEPVVLCKDSNLTNVRFEASVPNAQSVAVVAEGEWTHLNKNADGLWEGRVSLEQYKGRDAKVTLNANYGTGEENKFSTLLEYRV